MAKSPSQAKNAVMRCLRGIVDPYPPKSEVHRIWEFFDSTCVYCGHKMSRSDRKGHLDHLVAFRDGGANDIGNYVLACGQCNGDEKLAEIWTSFLRRKNPDETTFQRRKTKILEWVAFNASNQHQVSDDQRQAVLDAYDEVVSVLDAAVVRLRNLRQPGSQKKTIA